MASFFKRVLYFLAIGFAVLLFKTCNQTDIPRGKPATGNLLVAPGDIRDEQDVPAGPDLESWSRHATIAGREVFYWDSHGCEERNFRALVDPEALAVATVATGQIAANLGQSGPDPAQAAGMKYPAYVAKLMCSRRWKWSAIDADGRRIENELPIKPAFLEKYEQAQALTTKIAEQQGMQQMLAMNRLIDGLVVLHWIKLCAPKPNVPGCEDLAKHGTEPKWRQAVAFAKAFAFDQDYGAPTPQRLLLASDPQVAIFTDYSARLSADTIASAPIMNDAIPKLNEQLLGLLAEIDEETLPLTANAGSDNARALVAVTLMQMLDQRKTMKSVDPEDFGELGELSVLFIAQAEPPSCKGAVADRQGFYCPDEGVIFIAANDPLRQHSVGNLDLYGPSIAVLVHELAHYALHRTETTYTPFVDEGLATATGERALAGIIAGRTYALAHKAAAAKVAQSGFSDTLDTATAEREVQKVQTSTQIRLICSARVAPVTADEIERDLKMDAKEFQAHAARNYAVAWLVAEVELGHLGPSAGQPANLAKLFDLERQFNLGMKPGTAATLRSDLQALAARANALLARYPKTVNCGATA